jgi:DNA-binding NarL/FixJ family response regulator
VVVDDDADVRAALRLVLLQQPDIATVIAPSARPEARQHAIASGATGFVSKGDPPERVVEAVRVHAREING